MAVLICPSCRRESIGNPQEKIKCPHCWGLINPGDRRQGLVRGTSLCFDRYQVEEQIGRGGFAITYRVTTQVGAQRVNRVVKEYFPNGFAENQRAPGSNMLVIRPEHQYSFATYCDAFKLEASHLDGLHDIKGVVRFYDFFAENDTWYIVMQALEGQDLFHYTLHQPQHYLQLDDAVNIVRQILRIMSNVYRVQPMDGEHAGQQFCLIHRDLSLGNIIRASDGSITVIDFGSARYMYEQLDSSSKAHYTPVEQINNSRDQGQYTDVYAIGKMFYFLLCGSWPRAISNREWINQKAKFDLPPVRESRPEIPAVVDEIIKKATQYEYRGRYQTADDFLKAITQIGKGGKSLWPVALIGAGLVTAGVLVALLAGSRSEPGDEQAIVPAAVSTTVFPSAETTESPREYAYVCAMEGAALCTDEDAETAVAMLLTDGIVYAVQKGESWSTVMLNWDGEECSYCVENRWLKELSWNEAVEYDTLASVDGSAIRTADDHYLLAVAVSPAASKKTAQPAGHSTTAPSDTPAPMPIMVEYVNENGHWLDETLYEVSYGENLTIEAGIIAERYEVPQATTYELKWEEDGTISDSTITVQCRPTPTPAPVTVKVSYVNEAGEMIASEELTVTYEQNWFLPKNQVEGYDVQIDESPVIHWNVDGSVQKDEFVFYCVPKSASVPSEAVGSVPALLSLGMEQVVLVYGQTLEFEPVFQHGANGAWPQLSFDSNGYVSAEQQDGKIILTAARVGEDQLTVIDDQGIHTLMVKILPAVKSLSSSEVVLSSPEDVCTLDMVLEAGAEIHDFRYTGPAGISVLHEGNQLLITADGYVNDILTITAGGRSFKVPVTMKDTIEHVQLYRAPLDALHDHATWQAVDATVSEGNIQLVFNAAAVQGEALLISPATFSGTLNQVICSGNATYNDALGMYQIDLSENEWKNDEAAPVTLTVDDTQIAVSIYTGAPITNLNTVVQALGDPIAAGNRTEINLAMYPTVQVAGCSSSDEGIALVNCESGKLSINAIGSGDTELQLTLSTGEVVTLPLSVRQQLRQLTAEHTSTCVGEDLIVQLAVPGSAVEGEFTAELSNDGFSIVSQTADTIVLRAEKVGYTALMVTDVFGDSTSIELRANTTVVGLERENVTLHDGETTDVQILLQEGKKLPGNITIVNQIGDLQITRNDATISLLVKEGAYVNGTVIVDVDGEQFPLHLSTSDRVKEITVYHAAQSDLNSREHWTNLAELDGVANAEFVFKKDEAAAHSMIFDVKTLSGSVERIEVPEWLTYDAAAGVYFVDLNRAEFTQTNAAPATFRLGDQEISASIYTGELFSNMHAVRELLSAPVQMGQSVQVALSLYDGAMVMDCSATDPNVARAQYIDGSLIVDAIGSGDTVIRLTMAPTGEVAEIPISVRQTITSLSATQTAAYLGETISVRIDSQGLPLANEFRCELSGSSFAIVEQTVDTIVLRADSVGDAVLTVTDTFGTKQELAFKAASVVNGLSTGHVVLTDGVTGTVEINVAQGLMLPENISIRHNSDNLTITQSGNTLSLTVTEGKYVHTTVYVVVDGVEYPLQVSTADRLQQVSVWYTKNSAMQNQEEWRRLDDAAIGGSGRYVFTGAEAEGSSLILIAQSLSGSGKEITTSADLTVDEALGAYCIHLDQEAFRDPSAEPMVIALGDTSVNIYVYAGTMLLNQSSIRNTLQGHLVSGQETVTALALYQGASVQACEVRDNAVASAAIAGDGLHVTGATSGDTVIMLTMAPTEEVIEIPVSVRQQVEVLSADTMTAYVGEQIRINADSQGTPLADEFTYQLDTACFSLTEVSGSAASVRAERAGSSVLTVTDRFGNARQITLNAESVVTGLSESSVTMADGETKQIAFVMAEGKTLSNEVVITNNVAGLNVSYADGRITLQTDSGAYAEGAVTFEVEGKVHTLEVHTRDRITYSGVKYPDAEAENYSEMVSNGMLLLDVQTLSGRLDHVSVSAAWQIASVGNEQMTLQFVGDAAQLAAVQQLGVLLNEQQAAEYTIDYPNAILGLPSAIAVSKANSAVTLTVGSDGFTTLFGTLEDISYSADGLVVTQEGDKVLHITRESAGTGMLMLHEKSGRSFAREVPFDAYLQGVMVNGETVLPGGHVALGITEGESLDLTLNIMGGGRDHLKGFSVTSANSGCVVITDQGSALTLSALAPGSTNVVLSDQYGDIVVDVAVAQLWRFPNENTTPDEIREVSYALRALQYQQGRVSSEWNAQVEAAVLAWKKANGYASEAVLYEAEYAQLLAESSAAVQTASAIATPVPAFAARSGQTAVLSDIAAGVNELYLLDDKGWVIVMGKNGNVLDAFPAEESASYTSLYDAGDVPLAEDNAQMYMLHSQSLNSLVSMYKHRNSNTYLYNMVSGLQSSTISKKAAMSQDSMIIVLAEDQSFSVHANIVSMRAGQAVYSLDGSELAPLYLDLGKSRLCSNIVAAALDDSTFALATSDYRLYLFGAANELTKKYSLNTVRVPEVLMITVDGRNLQQNVAQIALSNQNVALRLTDGTVLVGGANVPGRMGQVIKEDDTFAQCSLSGSAKDIALSDTTLYILTYDGRLLAQGKGSEAKCTQLQAGISAISADDTYGYAITTDGRVYRMDGSSVEQMTSQVVLP